MFRKLLMILLALTVISNVNSVIAQDNTELSQNNVAVGISNSEEQISQLFNVFGIDTGDASEIILVDGDTLNEYLQDGSNSSTNIYSSALVNMTGSDTGVSVEILTPENITVVSESAYQNAAITAGATNAEIKIASVVTVTGEGALGGVYKIFDQLGYSLQADDIQTAENLIQIEEILLNETNMSEREISQLITRYNLAIVYAVEGKDELSEQEVFEILATILNEYDFQYSENVRTLLLEHGLSFSKSDVSKNPDTKAALEETMNQYELLNQTYKHGDIEVEIKDMYLTDERDEYAPDNYDNVFTVQYTVTNLGDMETFAGQNLTLYVKGQRANDYYLFDDFSDMVSPNRSITVKQSFGFNGAADLSDLELELQDWSAYGQPLVVIKVDGSQSELPIEYEETEVVNGLNNDLENSIENQLLIDLLKGFEEAGLNVYEPKIMTREDYGIAPLLADEAVNFGAQFADFPLTNEDGTEDPYNYGRLYFAKNKDNLEIMKSVYDDLAKQSAMFYSHTYSKGEILLQMGGDVPDEDFAKYVSVIEEIVD